MKLFLSWSGERGKDFAKVLRNWIELVLGQTIDFFLSDEDVRPGHRWSSELAKSLDEADLGILCLTSESLSSQWIGFEAGWLAKRLGEGTVIPLLLDVDPNTLTGPLAQFQCKRVDERGMLDIAAVINENLATPVDRSIVESRVTAMLSKLRADLEPVVRWGKEGIVAEYVRLSDSSTLKPLYEAAEKLIINADDTIEVLTSGGYDNRYSNEADKDAHRRYIMTLVKHLSDNPQLSYREIMGFDINFDPKFSSNEMWREHVKAITGIGQERANVNIRQLPPDFESLMVIDKSHIILERSEVFQPQEKHIVGFLSLKDSEGNLPLQLSLEFASYWDRGGHSVYLESDAG